MIEQFENGVYYMTGKEIVQVVIYAVLVILFFVMIRYVFVMRSGMKKILDDMEKTLDELNDFEKQVDDIFDDYDDIFDDDEVDCEHYRDKELDEIKYRQKKNDLHLQDITSKMHGKKSDTLKRDGCSSSKSSWDQSADLRDDENNTDDSGVNEPEIPIDIKSINDIPPILDAEAWPDDLGGGVNDKKLDTDKERVTKSAGVESRFRKYLNEIDRKQRDDMIEKEIRKSLGMDSPDGEKFTYRNDDGFDDMESDCTGDDQKSDSDDACGEKSLMYSFKSRYSGGKVVSIDEEACDFFLQYKTPKVIKEQLDQYIIKQDEVKKQCATLFYHHVARLVNPDLPRYNLLIVGGSGTGKTEIWRVLKSLYKDSVNIEFINCSTMTQEGYAGGNKLASNLLHLKKNTILVFDEFDKLCMPHWSMHENFSPHIQAEFLKMMEGEYDIRAMIDERKMMITDDLPSPDVFNSVSLVFLGAFESIFEKRNSKTVIGFNQGHNNKPDDGVTVTEEELLDFGIIPELLGRITQICCTENLELNDYLEIANNASMSLSPMRDFFDENGLPAVISDGFIKTIAEASMKNKTGARWMIGQMVKEYLSRIYEKGYYEKRVDKEIKDSGKDNDYNDNDFYNDLLDMTTWDSN